MPGSTTLPGIFFAAADFYGDFTQKRSLNLHRLAIITISIRKWGGCYDLQNDRIMPQLARSAGATEALKATDPMKWVGLMNACRAQAEEIAKFELIYV